MRRHDTAAPRCFPRRVDSAALSSILSFASVAAQHSGNYSCRARNEAGQADKHSYLQVKGRCQEPLLISHLFVSCTQN